MSRTSIPRGLLVAAVALIGCGRNPELSPAPGSIGVEGPGQATMATYAGVRLVAQVQLWQGDPKNLPELMTPVRVEVFNGSDQAIQVRPEVFELVTANGERLSAASPYEMDKEIPVGMTYKDSRLDRDSYNDSWRWADPFHRYYFDPYPYYSAIGYVSLPTDQMVSLALPEGMVEPGATVAGFLYFGDIDQDETRARLDMTLVGARTGDMLGTLQIPFTVH